MQELKGKTVFITGAARGLGEQIVRALAPHGARIVAADIRDDLLAGVAEAVRREGGDVTARTMDVRDPSQVDSVIDRTVRDFGPIDILINNAAVDVCSPVEELAVEDFDKIIATNLRASFLTIRKVLPGMRERRRGDIVNIASTAGVRVWPCASGYHASKWGLVGFTHAMDKEARPHNVRVTAIVAGGMNTPFITERFPDVPLDTLADPRAVANAVLFAVRQPEGVFMPILTIMPLKDPSFP